MGYQAIVTKYIGPRDVRGSRVKATAQVGSVTLNWNDALPQGGNHILAAKTLAEKYGWRGHWFEGGLPRGETVFVCADGDISGDGNVVPAFSVGDVL